MYEFSEKDIRKEFKTTEYGKKTNKWLYISLAIALVLFFVELVLQILVINNGELIEELPYCRMRTPYTVDGLFHHPYDIDF